VGNFGIIQIQGFANSTAILITLYNIDEPGTYALGMGGTNVGGVAQVTDLVPRGWSTPLSGAAGSITLSTLTASRIAGTFAFTADSILGTATGSRAVTQGQFDLLLGGNFAPLPDNYGSTMAGTVGGAAWTPSTVVITLLGTTLVIGANNTSYTLGIGKTSFPGPGSYTVGNNPSDVVVTMMGPGANPNGPVNCCWGGVVGATGTLNISSVTATRLQGTLTATLPPNPGTAANAPLTITNLTFDIGRP